MPCPCLMQPCPCLMQPCLPQPVVPYLLCNGPTKTNALNLPLYPQANLVRLSPPHTQACLPPWCPPLLASPLPPQSRLPTHKPASRLDLPTHPTHSSTLTSPPAPPHSCRCTG